MSAHFNLLLYFFLLLLVRYILETVPCGLDDIQKYIQHFRIFELCNVPNIQNSTFYQMCFYPKIYLFIKISIFGFQKKNLKHFKKSGKNKKKCKNPFASLARCARLKVVGVWNRGVAMSYLAPCFFLIIIDTNNNNNINLY